MSQDIGRAARLSLGHDTGLLTHVSLHVHKPKPQKSSQTQPAARPISWWLDTISKEIVWS